jgi:hypothetical protein
VPTSATVTKITFHPTVDISQRGFLQSFQVAFDCQHIVRYELNWLFRIPVCLNPAGIEADFPSNALRQPTDTAPASLVDFTV